ncbi:MAG: argininosuccinate lyase [Pseudomonadota bacterium]
MSKSQSSEDDLVKPWQGRFTAPTDAFVEAFTASITFDQRLYAHDIAGSIAHATMLERVGVLNGNELGAIIEGLSGIKKEIESGTFRWSIGLEDVHMNIEAALTERIGEPGKKLHTGRSRNDQVATDMRLYLRDETDAVLAAIRQTQTALLALAEREAATLMPGFTHLQVAQPVSFGHHMMAWFEMLERDHERFVDARKRVNRSPLGAAALAGTTFPIDRALTAELLGFDEPCHNSLDAVSDRDFVIEFIAAASLLMTHLSRFSEELILWSTNQFDFVELSDAFCTGSSIMPQKKNPDVPELVRGKSGRVVGHLMAMLTVMKAQPLAYNKDNQEDKEPLFDTIDNVKGCLKVYAEMLPELTVKAPAMRAAAAKGFITATDLADYLVRKGLAFRDAHSVVGQAVRIAIDTDCDLSDLPLDALQSLSDLIADDVYAVLTLEGSLNARDHLGAPAAAQVRIAVSEARARIKGN